MKGIILINNSAKEKLPSVIQNELIFGAQKNFSALYSETLDEEKFDANKDKDFVLIKRLSFSMNFRDKTIIGNRLMTSGDSFFFFGSDFCAEVVEIGVNISNLKKGDRVIGNNSYSLDTKMQQGIPSSDCSKEIEKIRGSKLVKIDNDFSIEDAGVFSVNAQTAFAVYRRLGYPKGKRVLITSGLSLVSLYVAQILAKDNDVTIITSESIINEPPFSNFKMEEIIKSSDAFDSLLKREAYYDIVFDPFVNRNLNQFLWLLKFFGKYIFCGSDPQASQDLSYNIERKAYYYMVVQQISLMGTCLGETEDLNGALRWFKENDFKSFYSEKYNKSNVGEFLDASWSYSSGIGRPVFLF